MPPLTRPAWGSTPPTQSRRSGRTALVGVLVLVVVASASCAGSDAANDPSHKGELAIADATIDWPANPDVAAAMLTIENNTDVDDALLRVTSADAKEVSVHRSGTDSEGRSTMKRVPRLEVPAGEEVVFDAWELHVMLNDPVALEVGDSVTLPFKFEKAGLRTVRATVIEPGTAQERMTHDG